MKTNGRPSCKSRQSGPISLQQSAVCQGKHKHSPPQSSVSEPAGLGQLSKCEDKQMSNESDMTRVQVCGFTYCGKNHLHWNMQMHHCERTALKKMRFVLVFNAQAIVFNKLQAWIPVSQHENMFTFTGRHDCLELISNHSHNDVISCDGWPQMSQMLSLCHFIYKVVHLWRRLIQQI